MRSRIPTLTPERYHRLARIAFILLTVAVFTGVAVRLTGSGLGCPDWPRCAAADKKIDMNARKYPVEKSRGSSKKYTEL